MNTVGTSFSVGTVVKSLAWKFFERGGVQVVQFIISIILARLLTPTDYGSVALLVIFTSIASVFVQSGLSSALIQKNDTTETDFSSVAIYCFTLATLLYALLFMSAPAIAAFYKMPQLVSILRAMALILFPGALSSIQLAILTKQLLFKTQFYASITTAILSGIVGIYLAYSHYGAWALVFQQLSYQVFLCILLWFLVPWRPKLLFSYTRTKTLLHFGSKLLGATLIDTVYHNLESLILGKKYSAETLAFCNKGKMFPLILINNIDGAIQNVMFSVYSKRQDEISVIKQMLRRTMATSTFLVFPAMLGLACTAKPLILFVLGEKWAPAIPYVQLYCLISMCFPLQTANLQAINAIGRSDVYFKLMLWKRAGGVIILALAVLLFNTPFSVIWACFFIEILGILINLPANIRLLHYEPKEMLIDILPNLILALLMCIPTYYALHFNLPTWAYLLIQPCIGILCYILLSWLTHNPNLRYIIEKYRFIKSQRRGRIL